MNSAEALSHQGLIDFQFGILESLAEGKAPTSVAQTVREKVEQIYGDSNDFEIGISVNDSCNLTCQHCYYASTHDKSLERKTGLLGVSDWKRIIRESLDISGVRHFSVIGKEPLLSPDITSAIFKELEGAKAQMPDIKYELITNGTLIGENADWLKDLDFHFVSISFDGCERDHDEIRGPGNYVRARKGLEIAAKEIGVRNLSVTYTAMPHNTGHLDEMITDLADAGAKYLSVSFCFPTDHNNNDLTAQIETFDRVIEQVRTAPKGIDITLNLSGDEGASLIGEIYRRGDIQRSKLAVTEDFAPSLIMPLSQSPRTAIQFNILPIMYYAGFRIDCTGAAMDYCSNLQDTKTLEGFGNVKKDSMLTLRDRSRSLWPAYTEEVYTKLQSALREERHLTS